jgi:MFS family permease
VGARLGFGISVVWIPLAFLGDGLTTLVLPSALAGGTSATALGLITFAGIGLGVLVQPLVGRLSDRMRDRVDRRAFMAACTLPALAALALLAVADSVPLAAVAFLATMLAGSSIQAAQQTLIPEHIPGRAHGRAASLKTAFDIGGAFVAFLVLGWILESAGTSAAVAVTAVVLIVAVAILLVLVPARSRRPPPRSVRSGPLRVPSGFWQLVLARFLFLFGVYAVGRFLLLLVADRLAVPAASAATETGVLLALFSLITAAAALVLARFIDRVGRLRVMAGGVLLAAAGTALFVPQGGLAGVVLAGTLLSVGTAAFASANWAAVTDLSPAADSGRLLGLANLGTGGAAAAAGLLGPPIDLWGFTPALLFATLGMVVALVPLTRPIRTARLEPTT